MFLYYSYLIMAIFLTKDVNIVISNLFETKNNSLDSTRDSKLWNKIIHFGVKRLQQNLWQNHFYYKFMFCSYHNCFFKTTLNDTFVNPIGWYNNYSINH